MAKPKKLKVYRTPIGFHDAYVAAPSQKAALEAWGSSHNLFARGVAEIVTDDTLSDEPLANPGKVIKRSRGTTAEQIAALPGFSTKPPVSRSTKGKPEAESQKLSAKPGPRPSRKDIEAAESELANVKNTHAEKDRELANEQAALDRRRIALKNTQQAELAKAHHALDRAEEKYASAMRRWRG